MTGTVITFYSYKGGVGRSFTLANIAVLLARWGHRVLCLDWDLEAPGLQHYFEPMISADPRGGVVDLVDDFVAGRCRPTEFVTPLEHGQDKGALHVMTAGRGDDPCYVSRVQEIDWENLYDDGFGDYLERCRDRWTAEYDYVLIDSRTGVSDIGGICTAHLPDRLVVLFTANVQSVRGAVDIAVRANAARDRMPYDRGQVSVIPVLSRFDSREEYDRSEQWRSICFAETEKLYGNWLAADVPADLISRHLTLPYVSYWSFGELLPVTYEDNPAADQISFALETVAALVAHGFDRTGLLAENRDAYVAAARAEGRTFGHEVRVSAPRSALDDAQTLVGELGTAGVSAELSLSGERSFLDRPRADARHLCLLVDRKPTKWQEAETELFLHRTVGQDRRVVPVLTEDTSLDALPGYLRNLQYLRMGRVRGPVEIARRLADQLADRTAFVDADDEDIASVLEATLKTGLHKSLWVLVDEIVDSMSDAVRAGKDAIARELASDLATVIRRRYDVGATRERIAVPRYARAGIERLLRVLGVPSGRSVRE